MSLWQAEGRVFSLGVTAAGPSGLGTSLGVGRTAHGLPVAFSLFWQLPFQDSHPR